MIFEAIRNTLAGYLKKKISPFTSAALTALINILLCYIGISSGYLLYTFSYYFYNHLFSVAASLAFLSAID
jgi:hypothetical protein